jgi:hypothetical protein
MPLNGVWSGRGGDVRVTTVYVYHFPEDKENRDPVHARLAKKIAAREAQKAAGYGQRQETGQGGQGGTGAQGN